MINTFAVSSYVRSIPERRSPTDCVHFKMLMYWKVWKTFFKLTFRKSEYRVCGELLHILFLVLLKCLIKTLHSRVSRVILSDGIL